MSAYAGTAELPVSTVGRLPACHPSQLVARPMAKPVSTIPAAGRCPMKLSNCFTTILRTIRVRSQAGLGQGGRFGSVAKPGCGKSAVKSGQNCRLF